MDRGEADFLAALAARSERAGRGASRAEILGAAYERTLVGTRSRRGGGAYYTPGFIVDAIVERTIGPLLEGASPEDAARLRVLDPACGAGSFLLGAYRYLLNWHICYYGRHPCAAAAYRDAGGSVRLTKSKKQEILSGCIYGVDLDQRAALVARASLYLELLEGEALLEGAGEPAPPLARALEMGAADPCMENLERNLRCGNALLESSDLRSGIPRKDKRRINAFDWAAEEAGFGRVVRPSEKGGRGGFDVVIGNPPYLRVQSLAERAPIEGELYRRRYASAAAGSFDIYVAFIERALSLLREGGRAGFIVPTNWWQAAYGAPLRRLLAEGRHYAEAIDFGHNQVFDDPTTYTCISIFTQSPGEALTYRRASPAHLQAPSDPSAPQLARPQCDHRIPFADLGPAPWYLGIPQPLRPLFERLRREGPFLADESLCRRVFQGLKTSLDPVYVLDIVEDRGPELLVRSRAQDGRDLLLERGLLRPIVKAGEMKRFAPLAPRKVVLFPYAVAGDAAALLSPDELSARYPAAWAYLMQNKDRLEARERGRMRHAAWYAYIYPKNLALFGRPKILTADMANRMAFSLDAAGELYLLGGAGGGYGILPARDDLSSPLLALLNSSLLEWMLRPPGLSRPFRGGWFSCEARFINLLPIRLPSAPADMRALGALAEQAAAVIRANRDVHADRDEPAKALARRQIDALEGEIDDRVFRLYGVTAAERRAIEEAVMEARRASGAGGRDQTSALGCGCASG